MLRLLAVLMGVLCSTIVLAELVGLGLVWSQGNLTNHNLYEVRLIMTGRSEAEDQDKIDENKSNGVSQQDVQAARVVRVLELESLGKELELLKTMTENRAKQLNSDKESFDEMKQAFRTELSNLRDRQQTEAVEQARAVLLASATEAAVERLMTLTEEEATDIVRGMPEERIAKILQGFDVPVKEGTGAVPDKRKVFGQKIFEALSRGEPARALIQNTQQQFSQGAAAPPDGGG